MRVEYLKVYPGNVGQPEASTVNFVKGQAIANMVLGVSGSRQIKLYANTAVHVVVDVTGTSAEPRSRGQTRTRRPPARVGAVFTAYAVAYAGLRA